MITLPKQERIEFGDFQTPLDLATQVCAKLKALGVVPDVILEPTCGLGAFVEASARAFPQAQKIIGLDINSAYIDELKHKKNNWPSGERVELLQADFFKFDWSQLLGGLEGSLLVLGNFPWVTNAVQGGIGGGNLPQKQNLNGFGGMEALTGKSNFDISEWMLRQVAQWFEGRAGYLAMLCKTSVARKFLQYLEQQQASLKYSALYGIDAQKHFGAAVEACLLVCAFEPSAHSYDYEVFESLGATHSTRVGHRDGLMVRDLVRFERYRYLLGEPRQKWRSGLKHDCAEVMELRAVEGGYLNGLGEWVDLEPTYLYPLLKGSDVANHRSSQRHVLVTQQKVGEPTGAIAQRAPKTWAYLQAHAHLLNARKSRIYQGKPAFSIFGIGEYSFAPYKVALCSLYKRLEFTLVEPVNQRPVMFDDTVYFLSFATVSEAAQALARLQSEPVQKLLDSLIFWDEKRPIKTGVLNRVRWDMLAESREEPKTMLKLSPV